MSAGATRASSGGFVSTGRLPAAETVAALVEEAHARFRANTEGAVSDVYPTLARSPADWLRPLRRRDERRGPRRGRLGHALHHHERLEAVRLRARLRRRSDPTPRGKKSASTPPASPSTRWRRSSATRTAAPIRWSIPAPSRRRASSRARRSRRAGLFSATASSRFAGRALALDEEVLACALKSNARNRAIGQLLQSYGRIEGDPADALELYTRQCSLNVTAKGSRRHGRDAGRRRGQSADQGAA